jgi:hypothetical protein
MNCERQSQSISTVLVAVSAGVLIDNKEFSRTCEFYYGDTTFLEAYEVTRKHVSISVSASTLGSKIPVCRPTRCWTR